MASDQLTAVFNAVETVSDALEDINRSINEQQRELSQLNADYLQNTGVTQAAEESQSSLAREINDVSRAFGEAQRSMGMYNALSQTVNAANSELSATAQMLQSRMDEVGDETSQATRRLTAYNAVAQSSAFSMGALSVNVGAFTIALRDLGTQIPILVTTLGSLIAVAGGAAGALTMLGGAISFFAIGGAVAMWQDLNDELGSAEEAAESLEAVMGALRDLFIQAFEPLANEENAQFLIEMVNWVARLTYRFAEFFDQVRPMIMDFMSNVSDATDDIDNMFTAMARGFRIVQPALEGMFIWLNNKLPGAIVFMSQTVSELREPLGRLVDVTIELTTSLVDLAGGALPALVTVVGLLLSFITALADIFNFLGDGITEVIFTFGMMGLAASKVLGTLNALSIPVLALADDFAKVSTASGGLIGQLKTLRAVVATNARSAFPAFSIAMSGTDKSAKQLTSSLGMTSAQAQLLAGRTGLAATAVNYLRGSLLSLLPAATKTRSGLYALKGTQGFVSPKDVTMLGLLKTQLNTTATAAINYARGAAASAIAATRSLAKRFALAALSGLQLFTALHSALIPGMIRTGVTANLTGSAISNMSKALKGLTLSNIVAAGSTALLTAATLAANAALAVFHTLTGGLLLALGALVGVGALVVGFLGNMHKSVEILHGAWGGLKNVITSVGNALLTVFVPIWNIFVEVVAAAVNILMILPRLLNKIAQRLGLIGEGGSLIGKAFSIVIDTIMKGIELIGVFLEKIEDAVGRFNELLGGGDRFEGGKVTQESVRRSMRRDRETADDEVTTRPTPEFNFEDNLEQNIDVQADPEEKEQMRRVVKDAMDEANALQRRREPNGG